MKSPGGLPVEATELLLFAAKVFEDLGIKYAVVGSMASSYFGDARLTHDVDIVADLPAETVDFPKPIFTSASSQFVMRSNREASSILCTPILD
jgi:hypothetical protein